MSYFYLFPDVYLVRGAARGMLYDVGTGRLRTLAPDDLAVVSACQNGASVSRSGQSSTGPLLQLLHDEGFGQFHELPTRVDPYIWAADRTVESADLRILIRTAYIQLSSWCGLSCSGCGEREFPVWQGCNSCERWPGTTKDARLSGSVLNALLTELTSLRVRTLAFCGGDVLRTDGDLAPPLATLKRLNSTAHVIVTTPAQNAAHQSLAQLAGHPVKLNLVVSMTDDRCVDDCLPLLLKAVEACRDNELPFYVTVHGAPTSEIIREWRTRTTSLGAQAVLLSAPIRQLADGQAFPLSAVIRDTRRAKPITGQQMYARRRHSECLTGVIAVAVDGSIRPCPMIPDVVGHMEAGGIHAVFAARKHEPYWSLTKDRIEPCRICEYRYACVDCAAVDRLNLKSTVSPHLLCDYDANSSAWHGHG